MIVGIKHKGLRLLYEKGDRSKIRPDLVDKAERLLTLLDQAEKPTDLDLRGFGLHALKGNLKGLWSVTVSRNHRIVFGLDDNGVFDVDLVDYH
jgi:proteic killer suppression protein